MVLIEIFLINVMTKVSKRTEMPKCKKHKLFGMSRQCKTPSKVAHVIRTLSGKNFKAFVVVLAPAIGIAQANLLHSLRTPYHVCLGDNTSS